MRHLYSLKAYDELRAYTIKHTLYVEALQLYKYQPEQLQDMTNVYADYLTENSKHKDAAIGMNPHFCTRSRLPPKEASNSVTQRTSLFHFTRKPTSATNWPIAGASPYTVH